MKTTLNALSILALFFCASCSGEPKQQANAPKGFNITFDAKGSQPKAMLSVNNQRLSCAIGADTLKAEHTSPKRRYTVGETRYTAKRKENKIKLYNSDEKLLWKVKVKEGKVKVSATEDGEPLYVIKYDGQGFKVKKGSATIGKGSSYDRDNIFKLKDANGAKLYEAFTKEKSLGFALLLMEEIPAHERSILMAELFLAGF